MARLTEGLGSGGGTRSPEDMLAWCDEQNRSRHAELLGRWYFVAQKDGEPLIDTLDGTDGEYARWIAEGKDVPDFVGWPPHRMNGYRRWLRGVVAKGLRVREPA